MTQRCLVSLVGEQTIPNILVAAAKNPDFMLLISTEAMERKNKSQAILDTLRLRWADFPTLDRGVRERPEKTRTMRGHRQGLQRPPHQG